LAEGQRQRLPIFCPPWQTKRPVVSAAEPWGTLLILSSVDFVVEFHPMEAPQPLWMTLAGVFGLGAVIGSFVSHALTTRWQHRVWINDNKKAEWRELIDVLRESIRVMAFRYDREMPWAVSAPEELRYNAEASRKGEIVIRDRIFISDTLQRSGVFQRWADRVKEWEEADVSFKERPKTLRHFIAIAHKFQDDLIRISREDLGIERPWYKFW
jgi:hypothetical protein